MMNEAAGWIPERWWRNQSLLKAIGRIGGLLTGSGRMGLTGKVPNGQRFMADPKKNLVGRKVLRRSAAAT